MVDGAISQWLEGKELNLSATSHTRTQSVADYGHFMPCSCFIWCMMCLVQLMASRLTMCRLRPDARERVTALH
jgi:hypothetical protein